MASMAKFLTRDEILAAQDIATEVVEVPEWGGAVRVRGLSGLERDELEASIVSRRGKHVDVNLINMRAKLVAKSMVDESGALLFSEEDVRALGKKSAGALQRVFEVAQRLAGLSDEDVEELTKNSESGQSGDSLSA
jgi:hypothetical protein